MGVILARRPLVMPSYVGYVGTRGRFATNLITADLPGNLMSRGYFYARDDIRRLRFIWYNGYSTPATGNTASGATATIAASIEYPAGTFYPFFFGGVQKPTNVASGTLLTSDYLSVPIPRGAKAYWRMYYASATGYVYTDSNVQAFTPMDTANGDACQFDVGDLTVSGSVTDNTYGIHIGPVALVGPTTRPSFYLAGDSRQQGVQDIVDANAGDAGYGSRIIGPAFAYCNAGCSGRQAAQFVAQNHAIDLAVAAYCSHVISTFGGGDVIYGTSNDTQAWANMITIWGYFAAMGKRVYADTVPSISNSANGFVAPDDQTNASTGDGAQSGYQTYVAALNNRLRGDLTGTGLAGYHEIADTIQTARDSGHWYVGTGAPFSTDGWHPNQAGNRRIAASGAIDVQRFAAPVWRY